MSVGQLPLDFTRRYVRVQLSGYADAKTGEPRACHHVVAADTAERVAAEMRARWPDSLITVELI